ncbi:helix-turn-helix transcriptional regulator [Aneurinibacillus aneurinilyticus]|uniref:helix-turn-helix domain-containing protein n=1 Tax=Aneurinibacillus aneurinilyticus TaxID=1391 RepID=UPI002E1B44D8|nr:helix-turn-helix transcriptional regulator [Aneurinibacillus aneurinilyticus]
MIPVNERIEEIRKSKGVTKAFLAKKLGITPMGYHYLATGRSPISTDRLQIIAKALETDAREFLRPYVNEKFSKETTTA